MFLCSSERGCVHQLAYRPSVQHVIDRTNGCREWGMSQGSDVHIVPLTHLGIVERVDQVRNKGRQMGLDGVDTSYNARSVQIIGTTTPIFTFGHSSQRKDAALPLQPVVTPELRLQRLEEHI